MPMLDDPARARLRDELARLRRPVTLVLFTQEFSCGECRDQERLLEEIAALSPAVSLQKSELTENAKTARELGVRRVPATLVRAEDEDHGIRFYGLTAGYELHSLLAAMIMISTGDVPLDPAIAALAAKITRPLHLEVVVTLGCPYCPKMVQLVHQLAMVNPQVTADMIEASAFPEVVQKYRVSGVPRTIINGRPSFEGAVPPLTALMEILKEAEPGEYERLDAMLREARGERLVREIEEDHRYDVVIVGAGPAAMSAAIYCARKDMDVALLGDHPGGQITDTATVENWLGTPEIGGAELAEQFLHHMEEHAVAEELHTEVARVDQDGDAFVVHTRSGRKIAAMSVIYCAGKRYRRLGVPGEAEFLGRGIAFCATCDAPLFRDKRVVVVGGGNSAFTAVRDLVPFATSIDLVHVLGEFQADPLLVEQSERHGHVTLHRKVQLVEFLGADALTGVRLQSTDGKESFDLPAEGVFLEIGLEPNSGPVHELVDLDPAGQIVVDRYQSSSVPGLFAAGDVTDEPEKQIVVAAAAGTKAALAAHVYVRAMAEPA